MRRRSQREDKVDAGLGCAVGRAGAIDIRSPAQRIAKTRHRGTASVMKRILGHCRMHLTDAGKRISSAGRATNGTGRRVTVIAARRSTGWSQKIDDRRIFPEPDAGSFFTSLICA